ncbi:MAG TPA: ATP-binding cassette domain-containing protein, partial [Flavisolibacter sp.]|nr:ATP-binding cassette domain-containing protein [Flavisolibacter sp.]
MIIKLVNAGKRFNREWIFRNAEIQFETGNSYAITGPNGSGKSTFLQTIGGMLGLSEGSVNYSNNSRIIQPETFYYHLSFCAPYLDVIEEMTITEFFNFHNQFQPFIKGYSVEKIVSVIGLEKTLNKQIRFYSSGMKQRVKLAQAIFSNTAVILLDEPCTNL